DLLQSLTRLHLRLEIVFPEGIDRSDPGKFLQLDLMLQIQQQKGSTAPKCLVDRAIQPTKIRIRDAGRADLRRNLRKNLRENVARRDASTFDKLLNRCFPASFNLVNQVGRNRRPRGDSEGIRFLK